MNIAFDKTFSQPPSNILNTVGNTPLVRFERLFQHSNSHFYGKLEAFNPAGSMKDRTSKRLIENALKAQKIIPGDTVVESSSGNMGIGLAQVCLYYGLKLIVVVDIHTNPQALKLLRTYGAHIICVDRPAADGRLLTARLQRVQEILDTVPGSYWPDQYHNPENPATHEETMQEIHEELHGKVDYMFAAASTCGTLMGCADYIRRKKLNTRLIAVDAVGSVLFGGQPAKRLVPGHGSGRPSHFLKPESVYKVRQMTDQDCVNGCRELLQKEAILAGGSSGAVIMAALQMEKEMKPRSKVALLLPDRGDRYLDTIYNEQWVSENLNAHYSNANVELTF